MKYQIFILYIFLTPIIFAQTSIVEIDGNSALKLFEGSKICADEVTVQSGSSLWANDYGQIKKSDCTIILTPTGDGTVTLPVEILDYEAIPTEFIIESAYPNPFNPTTNIKYGIPESSIVKIILYNIHGHVINVLFNEYQEAGWHTITWNGLLNNRSIGPAGIYLLKILTSSKNKSDFKSIKISLIK